MVSQRKSNMSDSANEATYIYVEILGQVSFSLILT